MTNRIKRKIIKLAATSASLLFGMAVSATAAPLSVCFMYSNPIGENGWTYQQELARKQLQENLGDKITTKYVENIPEGPDAERVMRNFIKDGCKVIFSPSFGFMEPTVKVARSAPKDVIFLNGSGYKTAPNLGVYNARYYEGRYVEGVVAGYMSKKDVIGYIGTFPIPEVLQGVNAFAQGLRSVKPDAKVRLIWVNTWYDPGKERDAANALIELGVDTIAYAASGLSIVRLAEEKGVYTLGYYSDMSRFGPKTSLTSVVMTWGDYYTKLVNEILDGKWKAGSYLGGLAEGLITMQPLNDTVPADVKEKVSAVIEGLKNKSIDPFAGPMKDQAGVERVAAGAAISQKEMDNMNYLVDNVDGLLPK